MAECPNKAAYQFMDLDTRTAAFFNIPFKMRADPFNMIGVIGSLQQQRFITAVLKVTILQHLAQDSPSIVKPMPGCV